MAEQVSSWLSSTLDQVQITAVSSNHREAMNLLVSKVQSRLSLVSLQHGGEIFVITERERIRFKGNWLAVGTGGVSTAKWGAPPDPITGIAFDDKLGRPGGTLSRKREPYLFSYSREDDKEGEEERGETEVDDNIPYVLSDGGPVGVGVECGTALGPEGIEPSLEHGPPRARSLGW